MYNTRDNITGMLLYGEGNFTQLLEGEGVAVQQTYNRISNDGRHKGITHIAGGALGERNFPGWSMGFKSIDGANLATFDGYPGSSNEKKTAGGKQDHISINLLKAFISTAKILPVIDSITAEGH